MIVSLLASQSVSALNNPLVNQAPPLENPTIHGYEIAGRDDDDILWDKVIDRDLDIQIARFRCGQANVVWLIDDLAQQSASGTRQVVAIPTGPESEHPAHCGRGNELAADERRRDDARVKHR